jgi:hypothetical protein
MKNLYIVYLPKKEKEDINDRKILEILRWYSKVTCYKNSIIASPGYMSTTDVTINQFLSQLGQRLSIKTSGANTNKVYYGLLSGMNANRMVPGANHSIIEHHNALMKKYNLWPIYINCKSNHDHRKVMCFFEYDTINGYKNINDMCDVDNFLNMISVNAVLIGSSNQSYTTYFEPIAQKGEADIFMFLDKQKGRLYNSIIEDDRFNNTVIAESVHGDENPEEFLKNILRDLLTTNILIDRNL